MRRVARWVDACEVVNERGLFSAQGMTQLINIQGDRSVVCFHACCKVNATRIPRECHHQQLHVSPTAHQSHVQSPHVIDRSQTDPSFGGGGLHVLDQQLAGLDQLAGRHALQPPEVLLS